MRVEMIKKTFTTLFTFLAFLSPLLSFDNDCVIDFPKVPMRELVRFISRISHVNIVGDESLLDFDVSFYSGKESSPEDLLNILLELMHQNGLEAKMQGDYYIVTKAAILSDDEIALPDKATPIRVKDGTFHLHKLQFHQGSEIMNAIKQMATDMSATRSADDSLLASINSIQWIESTNSLFFSGNDTAIGELNGLIKTLDTPIKQVFIEVLVVETSMTNSLDFGVQWSVNSKIKNRLGMGGGAFEPTDSKVSFAETMQSIDATNTPTGLNQMPLSRGFDLGIIGDIIFHKGKSFLSLGSLLTMLQGEGDCSIVLNQKILAQENKTSTIFVGDNLPFAGSVVQTIGSSQQTTANIEYRDVGVSLNIVPLVGENGVVTLKITEEITEAMDQPIHKGQHISGIKTSKTNMSTSAHVPDSHFLILSGMTRNVEGSAKTGVPCLGGLPMIGSLFSKKEKKKEKSSILIFVKPTIISTSNDYIELSAPILANHS